MNAKPAVVLGVLLLAGCVGGQDGASCTEQPIGYEGVQTRGTSDAISDMTGLDPRQEQDLLFSTWGWTNGTIDQVTPWNGTPGPIRQASTQLYTNGTGGLVHARFDPFGGTEGSDVRFGAAWVFESSPSDACSLAIPLQKNVGTTIEEGDLAEVGQGVRVLTAGFWENGTLFYTNMQGVHDSEIPRAGWYEWGGADPLAVYVYDRDRTERPAYWAAPTSQRPPHDPLGPPFDDAEATAVGTAAGAEGTAGIGYSPTIKGFNEALKGLSTTTSRVVWVAPEDAYTLAGNEAHVLYGDAVVFLIRVVEVVPAPCPNTAPCGVPDVPL